MQKSEEIVNRVANSSLVVFDLETLYVPGDRVLLDISGQLHGGMILREKDFRQFIKDTDWSVYEGKHVAVYCTADAIIPVWAYMLLVTALNPYARRVVFGDLEELETRIFLEVLAGVDWSVYRDARVVVKGCSKVRVPQAVYVDVTAKLAPVAASIFFGEPCSTVPVYKRAKRV